MLIIIKIITLFILIKQISWLQYILITSDQQLNRYSIDIMILAFLKSTILNVF